MISNNSLTFQIPFYMLLFMKRLQIKSADTSKQIFFFAKVQFKNENSNSEFTLI